MGQTTAGKLNPNEAMAVRYPVVARTTLPEEVAGRLLALIRARELRPGDKLPPERTLAAMMDVSRPVLREALRALAFMRVVDIRQGSGTYVTSLEPRQLVSHLDLAFSVDSTALMRLLEARRVVEVGNAQLAAGRTSEVDLQRLASILDRLGAAIDDPAAFAALDIAFHDAICTATDNFVLAQFMGIINTLARVSRERTGARRDVREATVRDHELILQALRAGDPDAAARAMQAHLDHVEQALDRAIEATDETVPHALAAEAP